MRFIIYNVFQNNKCTFMPYSGKNLVKYKITSGEKKRTNKQSSIEIKLQGYILLSIFYIKKVQIVFFVALFQE